MIPSTSSAARAAAPQASASNGWFDKKAAASAIVSAFYMNLKGQKKEAAIKEYLFKTLAPDVVVLDLEKVSLTSEMMKEIAARFRELRVFHAVNCTLDGKAITTKTLASFFTQFMDVNIEKRSFHPALRAFDTIIKRAIDDNFKELFNQEKMIWQNLFPTLCEQLELFQRHLIPDHSSDQKSIPQIVNTSSSSSATATHEVATTTLTDAQRAARKLAKKLKKSTSVVATTQTASTATTSSQDPKIKAARLARKALEKAAKAAERKAEKLKKEQAEAEAQKKRQQEAAEQAKKAAAAHARKQAGIASAAEAAKQREETERAQIEAENEAREKEKLDAKAKKEQAKKDKEKQEKLRGDELLALTIEALSLNSTPQAQNPTPQAQTILDLRRIPINDSTFNHLLKNTFTSEKQLSTVRLPICALNKPVIQTLAAHKPLRELNISLCHSIDTASLPLLTQVTKIVCTRDGENCDVWIPYSQFKQQDIDLCTRLLPNPSLLKNQPFALKEIQALAQLKQLEYLDLDERASVTDEACGAIATLAKLKTLHCGKFVASTAGIRALAPLAGLQNLTLKRCRHLTNENLTQLSVQFPDMRTLAIFSAAFTDEGFNAFPRFTRLTKLLFGILPRITAEGYKKLALLKDSLEALAFYYKEIDEQLLLYLMTELPKLKFLSVTVTHLGPLPENVRKMAEAKKITLSIPPIQTLPAFRLLESLSTTNSKQAIPATKVLDKNEKSAPASGKK